jgi:UDP-N-acetylmuramoyl-tripeptide--D-alanyl-D-alanine ligase
LRENNGTAFVYADYDYLKPMSAGIKNIITYGTKEGDVRGEIQQNEPFLEVSLNHGVTQINTIKSQLVGDYNLPNILCAVQIGKYFSVPEEKIKRSIEEYAPSNSRSQLIIKDTNSIILDAYNANPTSMKAAIENFAQLKASKKVLMLGGMMELGIDSALEHQAIVDLIGQYTWDKVVLVGGDFANTHHTYIFLPDSTKAKDWYIEQVFENTNLLIKGSRSMQMEKILAE